MTNILAGGVALEAGFASQIAEAERQVRSFLVTATRYLAGETGFEGNAAGKDVRRHRNVSSTDNTSGAPTSAAPHP